MRVFSTAIGFVTVLGLVAPSVTQAALTSCPRTSAEARSFAQSLRKVRDVPCDAMFGPCSPATAYAPGLAKPYGLVPSLVVWEEALAPSRGKLSFHLTVSKERALAAIKVATGQDCRSINSFTCSFGVPGARAAPGGGILSPNLVYTGGVASPVTLVCQYWQN